MVDRAVDHGGGHDVVAEHLAPATNGLLEVTIRGAAFVAGGGELEEQVGGLGFEGDAADLVDDQQGDATSLTGRPGVPPWWTSARPAMRTAR